MNKFFFITDKSADTSVAEILAVMVRFFGKNKCKVTNALFGIVEVEDGGAEDLYKAERIVAR